MSNPDWTEEEAVLALDLYKKVGATDSRNPQVALLSALLRALPIHSEKSPTFRNPNSVALKVVNFAALDPAYGGDGMRKTSRIDRAVWERFAMDDEGLRRAADAIRAKYAAALTAPGNGGLDGFA